MLSDTKLDSTFPSTQFLINGFSVPNRLDRNSKDGGILLYRTTEQILSSTTYWGFIFWIKSKELEMACMLFLQSPQKHKENLRVLTEGIQFY